MKISSLIVGILLVGLFAGVFGVFFANISAQYGQDYNNSLFAEGGAFDKIDNITTQTATIKEGLDTDSTNEGITDLIGGFLKKGFAVIKVTFQSFDLMNSMAGEAIDVLDEKAGGAGLSYFKEAILAIIAVLFIFIVIGVLVGRDI